MGPSAADDDATRRALLEEQAKLEGQVAALTAQFDGIVEAAALVATDDEHDPEGHTIAFERQQVAALLRDARAHLTGVAAALERLEAGEYGRCASCGGPIGAERLEALPDTDRCVRCAR